MATWWSPFPRTTRPGPANAPLTLVQYADFQCPHCAAAHPEVAAIANELQRLAAAGAPPFSLAQVHRRPSALPRLRSSRQSCRFWEMRSLLYEKPGGARRPLPGPLREEGRPRPQAVQEGAELGVHAARGACGLPGCPQRGDGTPTFFINGKRYEGPFSPRRWWRRCSRIRGRHDERLTPATEMQSPFAEPMQFRIRRRASSCNPLDSAERIRARCMQEGGLTNDSVSSRSGENAMRGSNVISLPAWTPCNGNSSRGRHWPDPERREKPGGQKSGCSTAATLCSCRR